MEHMGEKTPTRQMKKNGMPMRGNMMEQADGTRMPAMTKKEHDHSSMHKEAHQ